MTTKDITDAFGKIDAFDQEQQTAWLRAFQQRGVRKITVADSTPSVYFMERLMFDISYETAAGRGKFSVQAYRPKLLGTQRDKPDYVTTERNLLLAAYGQVLSQVQADQNPFFFSGQFLLFALLAPHTYLETLKRGMIHSTYSLDDTAHVNPMLCGHEGTHEMHLLEKPPLDGNPYLATMVPEEKLSRATKISQGYSLQGLMPFFLPVLAAYSSLEQKR